MVSALLLLGAVFQLWYYPSWMEEEAYKATARSARTVGVITANAVAPALDFEDVQSAEDILNGLQDAKPAIYAAVQMSDGRSFAAWNPDQVPAIEPARGDEPEERRREGILDVVVPVRSKGGAAGSLVIGFDLADLEREQASIFWSVLRASAFLFGVGFVASLIVGTRIVAPIQELTRITTRIVKEGDLTQEIHISSEDEVGQLAAAFGQMVEKLRSIPETLTTSVQGLTVAADALTGLTRDQTASMQRQAASLSEASATTQEIRQTSALASSKAERVLEVALQAESFGASGQASIEASIAGLQDIREQVQAIVRRIGDLSERTLQVGEIIERVKDLADQSNVLAFNAAIEAAKAGEFGKGFAVVAREIRSLSDQSLQSTVRIREILSEIGAAIRAAAAITDEGNRNMEKGMDQIRSSGENLRQLTGIVQETSTAAKQIAASVSQQNAGIAQISTVIVNLNQSMDETLEGIRRAESAAKDLKGTSNGIVEIVTSFRTR